MILVKDKNGEEIYKFKCPACEQHVEEPELHELPQSFRLRKIGHYVCSECSVTADIHGIDYFEDLVAHLNA